MLDSRAGIRSFHSGSFLACRVSSRQLQIFERPPSNASSVARLQTLQSSLPDGFWSQFQKFSVLQAFNKMCPFTLMWCCSCAFILLFCTIASKKEISDPALLCVSQLYQCPQQYLHVCCQVIIHLVYIACIFYCFVAMFFAGLSNQIKFSQIYRNVIFSD